MCGDRLVYSVSYSYDSSGKRTSTVNTPSSSSSSSNSNYKNAGDLLREARASGQTIEQLRSAAIIEEAKRQSSSRSSSNGSSATPTPSVNTNTSNSTSETVASSSPSLSYVRAKSQERIQADQSAARVSRGTLSAATKPSFRTNPDEYFTRKQALAEKKVGQFGKDVVTGIKSVYNVFGAPIKQTVIFNQPSYKEIQEKARQQKELTLKQRIDIVKQKAKAVPGIVSYVGYSVGKKAVTEPREFLIETATPFILTEGIPAFSRAVTEYRVIAGRRNIPSVKIGEAGMPKTSSSKQTITEFEKTRTAEGTIIGTTAAPQRLSSTEVGIGKRAKVGLEDPIIYTTPKGKTSLDFLKVAYENQPTKFSLNPFAKYKGARSIPTITELEAQGISTIPKSVTSKPGFSAVEDYFVTTKGSGEFFVTKRSQIGTGEIPVQKFKAPESFTAPSPVIVTRGKKTIRTSKVKKGDFVLEPRTSELEAGPGVGQKFTKPKLQPYYTEVGGQTIAIERAKLIVEETSKLSSNTPKLSKNIARAKRPIKQTISTEYRNIANKQSSLVNPRAKVSTPYSGISVGSSALNSYGPRVSLTSSSPVLQSPRVINSTSSSSGSSSFSGYVRASRPVFSSNYNSGRSSTPKITLPKSSVSGGSSSKLPKSIIGGGSSTSRTTIKPPTRTRTLRGLDFDFNKQPLRKTKQYKTSFKVKTKYNPTLRSSILNIKGSKKGAAKKKKRRLTGLEIRPLL